jgi:hypothetical protein
VTRYDVFNALIVFFVAVVIVWGIVTLVQG